ncbi:MAG: zinc-ribbon domain-containing protein [Candidatus Methanomethylophilaceae archaeon]
MGLEDLIGDEIIKKTGKKLFGATTRMTVIVKQGLFKKTQGHKEEKSDAEGPIVTEYSLDRINNNLQCPKCGATMSSTVSKCSNCGTSLATKNVSDEHPVEDQKYVFQKDPPSDPYDPNEFEK